jgi:biotin carboxyl carrier protein
MFYTASSPSAPNFASVGETVQAGQVICIVEAMKVFNEIKSEISGVVTAIVAQNGQLVQKGEPLIRVKQL